MSTLLKKLTAQAQQIEKASEQKKSLPASFTLKEIIAVLRPVEIIGHKKARLKFNGLSTDTRNLAPGNLFIALCGEKYDGHAFIEEAVKRGATGFIVNDQCQIINAKLMTNVKNREIILIKVKDTLTALQELAAYHRQKFDLPVIGITGSCGKTTTKDMLASILAQVKPTLKNEENFNNEIGVPLTLLRLEKKHRYAVVEMGMQRLGEIHRLAEIAQPTIAIITNIGEAHLEYLENKKNVAKAKAEIFAFLRTEDFAIINADDEYFEHLKAHARHRGAKIVTFGILQKADIAPGELKGISLPLPGEHIIYNALAAVAAAKILKISSSAIKKGLETFKSSSKRLDIFDHPSGIRIINDTYNANPQSMEAALKILSIHQARKVAILGDMFELGKAAVPAHKKIGQLAKKLGVNVLIAVGKLAKNMPADYYYADNRSAIKGLEKIIRRGDAVLIKGSRGMHMEEIVNHLTN